MFLYLASPYTHADINVIEERYIHNLNAVWSLTVDNDTAYSPIVHFHHVARMHDLPKNFNFWQTHNENMLMQANELVVLTLPGWDTSRGVSFELGFARARGLDIAYMNPTTFELTTAPQLRGV